jgi:hypothetical protein
LAKPLPEIARELDVAAVAALVTQEYHWNLLEAEMTLMEALG